MNLRFALGFTLLILLLIIIFVGLPYFLQNVKSFDLFHYENKIDSYE